MRIFKNRAEAEAAGAKWSFLLEGWNPETWGGRIVGAWRINDEPAIVRTDLEAQLAEALEAVEWVASNDWDHCPFCARTQLSGHEIDCQLAAALRAFRGEE